MADVYDAYDGQKVIIRAKQYISLEERWKYRVGRQDVHGNWLSDPDLRKWETSLKRPDE